ATVRDDRGEQALKALPQAEHLRVERIDVAEPDDHADFTARIGETLDVLMLNAGVMGPRDLDAASLDEAEQVHRVNALGPAKLAFALIGKVRDRTGVVAFTTSGMGSIA